MKKLVDLVKENKEEILTMVFEHADVVISMIESEEQIGIADETYEMYIPEDILEAEAKQIITEPYYEFASILFHILEMNDEEGDLDEDDILEYIEEDDTISNILLG